LKAAWRKVIHLIRDGNRDTTAVRYIHVVVLFSDPHLHPSNFNPPTQSTNSLPKKHTTQNSRSRTKEDQGPSHQATTILRLFSFPLPSGEPCELLFSPSHALTVLYICTSNNNTTSRRKKEQGMTEKKQLNSLSKNM
jgi:hypothetical protein